MHSGSEFVFRIIQQLGGRTAIALLAVFVLVAMLLAAAVQIAGLLPLGSEPIISAPLRWG